MNVFNTEDDMAMHFIVLQNIAEADGVMADTEKSFIEYVKTLYKEKFPNYIGGLPTISFDECKSMMKTETSARKKLLLLQDAIALSWVDGEFAEEEQKMVHDIATAIGVPSIVVNQLFALNQSVVDANIRVAEFIAEFV